MARWLPAALSLADHRHKTIRQTIYPFIHSFWSLCSWCFRSLLFNGFLLWSFLFIFGPFCLWTINIVIINVRHKKIFSISFSFSHLIRLLQNHHRRKREEEEEDMREGTGSWSLMEPSHVDVCLPSFIFGSKLRRWSGEDLFLSFTHSKETRREMMRMKMAMRLCVMQHLLRPSFSCFLWLTLVLRATSTDWLTQENMHASSEPVELKWKKESEKRVINHWMDKIQIFREEKKYPQTDSKWCSSCWCCCMPNV